MLVFPMEGVEHTYTGHVQPREPNPDRNKLATCQLMRLYPHLHGMASVHDRFGKIHGETNILSSINLNSMLLEFQACPSDA